MRLRNKKTGEIIEINRDANALTVWRGYGENPSYKSISALLEEWEDYTPQEPRIEDEKIRKAIRAFAELHDSKTVSFEETYHDISVIVRADNGYAMLWLRNKSGFGNIEYRKDYTVTELCGEEE